MTPQVQRCFRWSSIGTGVEVQRGETSGLIRPPKARSANCADALRSRHAGQCGRCTWRDQFLPGSGKPETTRLRFKISPPLPFKARVVRASSSSGHPQNIPGATVKMASLNSQQKRPLRCCVTCLDCDAGQSGKDTM